MSFLRSLLLPALLTVSVGFTTPALAAANLSISPTQIDLKPNQKTGIVTLEKKGTNPVNLQLDAKSWDMDENGKFIETDTGDFVFYPKTLTIKPSEQASIRVGYTSDFPDKEKPYRVIIEEVPEITQPKQEADKVNAGITSVLRLSVPLYVVPANAIPAVQVELAQLKAEAQHLKVGIKNPTAYHVTLKSASVKLLKGNTTLSDKTVELKLQRILGNHQIYIDVPMDAMKLCQQADAVSIKVEADRLTPAYQTQMPLKSGCQL